MGISEFRRLPCEGLDHAWMLMPEARHRGAAGAVENAPAIGGNQPHAVAPDSLRRRFAQASMQDAALAFPHRMTMRCKPALFQPVTLQLDWPGAMIAAAGRTACAVTMATPEPVRRMRPRSWLTRERLV